MITLFVPTRYSISSSKLVHYGIRFMQIPSLYTFSSKRFEKEICQAIKSVM